MPDFTLENHGSVFLLRPQTVDGRRWLQEHLDHEALRWAGATVVGENYIRPLVDGILADGLTVE